MASALSGLREGIWKLAEQKRQRPEQELDQAVKYAQLAESGYNVRQEPKRGMFGRSQMVLERDPSFGAIVPEGFTRVSGKIVRDPSYLNPLQKRRMEMTGGDSGLTAGQRLAKDKATQELFGVVEQNKVRRQQLEGAKNALPNVPQGLGGRLKVEFAKRFNPNDPMLTDWQKIKMIGTDAQLLNTAMTKGAISDREMALFAQAAANDDIVSAPRLKPILEKLEKSIVADESAKFGAYQKNYGEDPRAWFGQGASNQNQQEVDPLEAEAQQAIANGADPNAVMQRLQQMRASRG